ncbi:MAG TPA: hypothetical protein DC049_09330 [Spirochaetia bacterium]|nr:hypothetical protein [Spirochaetia bacterium]
MKIEDVFDNCLFDIQNGMQIDECLRKYPQYAEELKSLLELSGKIKKIPEPEYNSSAFLAVLIKIGKASGKKNSLVKHMDPGRFFLFQNLFGRLASVILVVAALAWMPVKASAGSNPGDFFYPVKIFSEKIKLFLTIDKEDKIELHMVFADNRLKELLKIVSNREEPDQAILKDILDEIKTALHTILNSAESQPDIILNKITHFNMHQKEVFENIRPAIKNEETKKAIDEVIDMCGRCADGKSRRNMERMRCAPRKMNCPWQ